MIRDRNINTEVKEIVITQLTNQIEAVNQAIIKIEKQQQEEEKQKKQLELVKEIAVKRYNLKKNGSTDRDESSQSRKRSNGNNTAKVTGGTKKHRGKKQTRRLRRKPK